MLTEAIPRMMTPMPSRATDGMAQIASGTFRMGSDVHDLEELSAHNTTVDRFWIDTRAVTSPDFAAFAAAAGYVTFLAWSGPPALKYSQGGHRTACHS
jgi:formylglycine-generating enzyme required for sulfatase activity